MELRHLRYFVAVARERSFTRAAERLHIAQPPLSRQIQQLEEELGVALIERGTRPAHLTEHGRLFYEQAVQVLERIDEMQAAVRRMRHAKRETRNATCSVWVSWPPPSTATCRR
jgi:DNA-binding transcriptional LysR family regulator